jgi:hypothetical protein
MVIMTKYSLSAPSNYAMKATTVDCLALDLAAGSVAPYFGC